MELLTKSGPRQAEIDHLAIAGWTGRDKAAVEQHIAELHEIGVSPPSRTPLYYRVSSRLLTTAVATQVLGDATSGEAEPVIIRQDDMLFLGLGSDHTDRRLEKVSVAASKQACAKPISPRVWNLADVADHLDEIALESWIHDGDGWQSYQTGRLDRILPLAELLRGANLPSQAALFCGTLPAIGGIRGAPRFRAALIDPVRDRRIDLEYSTEVLPVVA